MKLPTLFHRSLSPTPSNGFTLLELLVTIALIGIVSAFALPGLNGIYHRQLLTNTAEEVVSTIKIAQNAALANNQPAQVVPSGEVLTSDCTANRPYVSSYQFRVAAGGDGYSVERIYKSAPCPVPSDTGFRGPFTLPNGVAFNSTDPSKTLSYEVVTGRLVEAAANPIQYQLTSQSLNISLYVCVTQGRVYAQSETC